MTSAISTKLIAAAMMGACTGFLWWNAAPAKVFMGDVGALGVGAGLAALALMTSTQLLLPIVGALYVVQSLSVMLQVTGYKLTKKRIFKMAPIHHHFELSGWAETATMAGPVGARRERVTCQTHTAAARLTSRRRLGRPRRARRFLRQALRRQGGLFQGARHRHRAGRILARHGGGQPGFRQAHHGADRRRRDAAG